MGVHSFGRRRFWPAVPRTGEAVRWGPGDAAGIGMASVIHQAAVKTVMPSVIAAARGMPKRKASSPASSARIGMPQAIRFSRIKRSLNMAGLNFGLWLWVEVVEALSTCCLPVELRSRPMDAGMPCTSVWSGCLESRKQLGRFGHHGQTQAVQYFNGQISNASMQDLCYSRSFNASARAADSSGAPYIIP